MRNATEDAEFLEDADVSGLGLGLYLGKNIMERMNGSISVEIEVGRGITFTLHLPAWDAASSTTAEGELTKEEKNGEAVARR